MASFKLYYPVLHLNEGGYANNPNDVGGETYAGIARKFWPNWAGWKRIDTVKADLSLKVKQVLSATWLKSINKTLRADTVLQDMIFQFYKINYWNSLQLDFIDNQYLAQQLCDMGINAGAMRPAKMIQWLINCNNNQQTVQEGKLVDTSPKPLVVDGDLGPASISAINYYKGGQAELYNHFVLLRRKFYYYRVGQLREVPQLQRDFFSQQLNLRSKPDQVEFLAGWLKRCLPATLPA